MLGRTLTQAAARGQEDICLLLREVRYARNIQKGEFE
ncbi:MAG: hypothetical protein JWO51_15 [Rhodospirillales bacterium]|nr:hypothetical protein [Rhodospirillales bacterium]